MVFPKKAIYIQMSREIVVLNPPKILLIPDTLRVITKREIDPHSLSREMGIFVRDFAISPWGAVGVGVVEVTAISPVIHTEPYQEVNYGFNPDPLLLQINEDALAKRGRLPQSVRIFVKSLNSVYAALTGFSTKVLTQQETAGYMEGKTTGRPVLNELYMEMRFSTDIFSLETLYVTTLTIERTIHLLETVCGKVKGLLDPYELRFAQLAAESFFLPLRPTGRPGGKDGDLATMKNLLARSIKEVKLAHGKRFDPSDYPFRLNHRNPKEAHQELEEMKSKLIAVPINEAPRYLQRMFALAQNCAQPLL